ncbi:hypothetical protein GH722_20610, partial [Alphaproteobacteria bacterium HT1-32]|nr:hypothetical protein [Alphaproteobacteria bacterium HT1-32]
TVSVDVVDDVPTANMDCDFVAGGVGSSTTGNVITGVDTDNSGGSLQADNVGADDPGSIVSIQFGDQSVSFDNPADVKTDGEGNSYIELQGEHGTIQMFADGSYEYTVTDTSGGTGQNGVSFFELGADDFAGASYDVDGMWNKEVDGHQITVSARDAYGNERTISSGERTPGDGEASGEFRGLGIAGGGDTEIDGAEILEVDFDGLVVNNIDVGLRALFAEEGGSDEVGIWVAFRDGQEVGRGDFRGEHELSDRENTDGQVEFQIDVDGGFDNVVFCVTNAQSDFFLEYMRNGEEGGAIEDQFSYTIEDSDGDRSTADLKFSVENGEPVLSIDPDAITIDEDDLSTGSDQSDPTSLTGDITVDFGSDGEGDVVLEIPQDLIDRGLTSGGEPVEYELSEDGKTITATAGGEEVFTLTLTEDGGSYGYNFQLTGNLDHPTGEGENIIEDLPFTVTATDSDGDSTSGSLVVSVVDDVPEGATVEAIDTATGVTLDEDDLADGTDGDKESLSASGDLGLDGDLITIDYGADGPADGSPTALGYDDLAFELEGPSGLTSQGEPVTYEWDASTNTLQATADGRDVFTVELNEDGTYTFTLQDSLDHGAADGENGLGLEFTLTGLVGEGTFTDFDGDSIDLSETTITQTFSVNVVDDTPAAAEVGTPTAADTVTLDEDDLADGTDSDKESLSASGDLGLDGDLITIDYGADGPADGAPTALGYDDLAFELEGPSGLTSQGEPVTYEWDASTNTLQATADGRDVFTVELNEDGTYTFTLQDSLDHGAADGENGLGLEFTLTGTPDVDAGTDYDLDPGALDGASVTQTFSVNVVDDTPAAAEVGTPTVADTVTLDEDDLADGTDDTKESLSASGDLGLDGELITIDYGADGAADGSPTALQYDDLDWALEGPAGLTSQGEAVTYSWDAATNTLQATADGRDVFTVELNEDGSYTFTLQDSLDHGAADGENSLGLEFTLTGTPSDDVATDYDLDPSTLADTSISQTFSVNVTDDVPEAAEVATPTVADTVTLDEDDLADGTDDTKESLSATGDLGLDGDLITIDYGADGAADGSPTALQYDDLDWALEGPAGLTSQGEAVTYSWDAATNTLQATADGRDVFTVELNEDGSYTFTLQDSLDHGAADGENSLGLEFTLTGTPSDDVATDYDLDPSTLADTSITQTFSVNVTDDVPEAAEVGTPTVADTVTLDEDDLADGTDDTKESLSASGDLGLDGDLITIDYGADGPADGAPTALGYSDLTFEITGPAGLTSEGEPVTYSW